MRCSSLIRLLAVVGSIATTTPILALGQESDWRTVYEKSNRLETGRYEEAAAYCKRLASASRGRAKVIQWGVSPQGRPLIALVMSREGAFTPQSASHSERPLVIINNGIHSGEIEGKDAGFIMARDILISGKLSTLLDRINILFIPIFSVDAHERFGPYNRINQNGPQEMGWRATSVNLNLNRDFMKADGEEMRAMIRLLHAWKPDFFFDNHTTDGADWQYTIQLDVPVAPTLASPCVEWSKRMLSSAIPKVEADGYLTSPYFDGVNYNNLARGLTISDFGPRYSTGYLAAINRPSMLVETHMLKPYRQRVEATYSINLRVMEYVADSARELKAANRAADLADANTRPGDSIILEAETTAATRPFTFRGLNYKPYRSEVSGGMIPAWTREPVNTETTLRDQYAPSLILQAPAGYAIPPQYKEIIANLALHGLKSTRLSHSITASFDSYRFEKVSFPEAPFESRFQPRFTSVKVREERTLPAGTVIVSTAQVGAKLLMQLLEPDAPDSLIHWGFLNTIFEQKEYFEEYAMEPIAAKMLEGSAALKAEFNAKLKDPAFAANRRARLQFFYERSPYADARLNSYPISRLTAEQLAAALQ